MVIATRFIVRKQHKILFSSFAWALTQRTSVCSSGGFRPGPGVYRPPVLLQFPSFVATHDFCKDNINIWFFLRYLSLEKWANLQLSLNAQKPKCFSFRGTLPPDFHQGFCLRPPLQTRTTTLAMGLCPFPKYWGIEPPLVCSQKQVIWEKLTCRTIAAVLPLSQSV